MQLSWSTHFAIWSALKQRWLVLSPLCSINPRSCILLLCHFMLIAILRWPCIHGQVATKSTIRHYVHRCSKWEITKEMDPSRVLSAWVQVCRRELACTFVTQHLTQSPLSYVRLSHQLERDWRPCWDRDSLLFSRASKYVRPFSLFDRSAPQLAESVSFPNDFSFAWSLNGHALINASQYL